MKTKLLYLIFFLFSIHGTYGRQTSPAASPLVYHWYAPEGANDFPAIMVIGGSEGGLGAGKKWAELLGEKGYGVMDLAYFGVKNLPEQLEEIPLEYFQKALDTLRTLKGVRPDAIGIICVSKGTEAAFLLAARNKSIQLIIAGSPSSVTWQSINPKNYGGNKSSWTEKSIPLPFLSYDYSRGYYPLINFYQGPVEKLHDEKVIISLEHAHATIVLLSGSRDQFWPSTLMSNQITSRLASKHYSFPVIHREFKEAGHGFLIPYQNEEEKKKINGKMEKMISHFGGTIEAFDQAMTESLRLTIAEILKMK